jgi:uncharacterized protein DUF4439
MRVQPPGTKARIKPTSKVTSKATSKPTIDALQAVLAAEHAVIYGYGVAGARLRGHRQVAAMRAWNSHRARRDELIAMLTAAGAQPVASADAYRLPFAVTSPRSAAALVVAMEDGITRSYLGLVVLPDPGMRTFGALAMQDAAARSAAWRGSTVPFPGLPPSVLTPAVSARGSPRPH